ncbi:hypothetical protein MJ1_0007 [Nanobdella aerobiophila]|uniref:Uncharacterized protein n=1 Tax=Nanobdella aerobiophila TaxID=2586965 RepID=A0A915SJQ2_9ARCH|nr:hypothetical protein [Nanobdella aerobiophila]BBL45188.1 hypothetical protein MJ1_0007 [Nanobdella aerobiophila]
MVNYFEILAWYNSYKDKINGSVIKNIYNKEDGIIFEIYKPGLDKRYLYIIPGNIIFLYNIKDRDEINNFILRLKKDFQNKRINIYIEDDKIIRIEDEKKIYIELIPNGLIIITDKEDKILYSNKYKDFVYRKIYKNEIYKKPKKNFEVFYDIDSFYNKVKNSDKKDIARSIAMDLSLGKKYSEYIIKKLNIDKDIKPADLPDDKIKEIYDIYKDIRDGNLIIDDDFNIVNDINDYFIKIYNSSNENKKIKTLNDQKNKILNIINEQKKYLEELNKEIEYLEKVGEFLNTYAWIFNNYDIDNIINKFGELNINVDIYMDNIYLILNIKNDHYENR